MSVPVVTNTLNAVQVVGSVNTATVSTTVAQVVVSSVGLQGPPGSGGSGSVSDGDKGDVIVSGSGAVWSLDYTAVNATIAPTWANITSKPAAVTALSGTNTGDQTITLTGDVTGTGTGSFAATLATVNSNVGSFGSATAAPTITVNGKGLLTAAGSVTITPAWSSITSKPTTLSGFGITDGITSAAVAAGYQPLDADLTTIAGLTATTDSFMQAKAGAWAARTIAQVKTDLGLTGTNSGDQTITLTGDVTGSGTGSFAATLATVNANTGAFGSATQVATFTVNGKGLITAAGQTSISVPATAISDSTAAGRAMVTAASATAQTALLDAFTSLAKGLAPASGGGTTNFLRADGTWAAPAGGGGVSDGDKGDVIVSGTGTVWSLDYTAVNATVAPVWGNITSKPTSVSGYGITDAVTTSGNQSVAGVKTFSDQVVHQGLSSDPASPADGSLWLDSQIMAPKFRMAGRTFDLYASLMKSSAMVWSASPGAAAPSTFGLAAPTAVGTLTAASIATTNLHTYLPRVEALVTVAATTAIAGFRGTNNVVSVGGPSAGLGGFKYTVIWGPATGVATTTNRAFMGLANITNAPTDVEPSTVVSGIWMGWDAADTNIQMMFNDAAGTATKVDLGASFAVPTVDRTSVYMMELYCPRGTTQSCQWRVTDLVNGTVAQGTQTTDLPTTSTLLAPRGWMSVGGTSSVIGLSFYGMFLNPML